MASSSAEVLHLSVLCKRQQQQQQLGTTNCRIELSPADAEAIDVLAGEQVLVVPLTREGDDVLTLDSKGGSGEKATCKRDEGAGSAWGAPIAAVCTLDVAAAPVDRTGVVFPATSIGSWSTAGVFCRWPAEGVRSGQGRCKAIVAVASTIIASTATVPSAAMCAAPAGTAGSCSAEHASSLVRQT